MEFISPTFARTSTIRAEAKVDRLASTQMSLKEKNALKVAPHSAFVAWMTSLWGPLAGLNVNLLFFIERLAGGKTSQYSMFRSSQPSADLVFNENWCFRETFATVTAAGATTPPGHFFSDRR